VLTVIVVLVVLILFDVYFKARRFDGVEFDPVSMGRLPLDLFMMPNTSIVRQLASYMQYNNSNISSVTFFDNKTEMENFYLKEGTDRTFGIEFVNLTVYKIYTKWEDSVFNDTSVKLEVKSRDCRIRNETSFNPYTNCAGNKFVYNGFTFLQYHLNFNIIKVRLIFLLKIV
jgi:hypothetical protein